MNSLLEFIDLCLHTGDFRSQLRDFTRFVFLLTCAGQLLLQLVQPLVQDVESFFGFLVQFVLFRLERRLEGRKFARAGSPWGCAGAPSCIQPTRRSRLPA